MEGKVWLAAVLLTLPVAAAAQEDPRLKVSADLRFRLESDWDSRRADGTERDDRSRARLRFRVGVEVDVTPSFDLGARVRTGSAGSQQSPHVTVADFDGNPNGDQDLLPDRWYLRWHGSWQGKGAWAWAGRNAFPFWKPSEFLWDDDVQPAGAAAGLSLPAGSLTVTVTGAALVLPDGGYDFHGDLAGGQVVLSGGQGGVPWTAATGYYRIEGEPGARFLANGNGERDYGLWVSALRAVPRLGGRPLALSFEWMENLEDYRRDDPDPFTAANSDETRGFAAGAQWGEAQVPGDWLVGYAYARIEALAVHASYAQDDWVRWGSASQTDASDFRGHELRFAIALPHQVGLVARLFLAESLTSPQDGNRARVDLNYKF